MVGWTHSNDVTIMRKGTRMNQAQRKFTQIATEDLGKFTLIIDLRRDGEISHLEATLLESPDHNWKKNEEK